MGRRRKDYGEPETKGRRRDNVATEQATRGRCCVCRCQQRLRVLTTASWSCPICGSNPDWRGLKGGSPVAGRVERVGCLCMTTPKDCVGRCQSYDVVKAEPLP